MSTDSIKPDTDPRGVAYQGREPHDAATARDSGTLADFLVPPAMLLVAIAAGLACTMHLGFAPELAAAIGLTIFCIMLLAHVLLRNPDVVNGLDGGASDVESPLPQRPRAPRAPVDRAATRRNASTPATADAPRPPGKAGAVPPPAAMPPTAAPAAQPAMASAPPKPNPASEAKSAAQPPASPPRPTTAPAAPLTGNTRPPALPDQSAAPGRGDARSRPPELPRQAAPDRVTQDKPWTYRPVDLQLPVRVESAPAGEPLSAVDPAPAQRSADPAVAAMLETALSGLRPTIADDATGASSFGTPPLSEQQRVEQILKRLASQIRAGGAPAAGRAAAPGTSVDTAPEAAAPTVAAPAVPAPAGAAASGSPAAGRPARAALPPTLPEEDTSLESAVNTLRSTVEAMRAGLKPAAGARAATPERAPSAAELRLAAVADALAAERAHVFLQPILALRDESAHHFEVSVRLQARNGETLERAQVLPQIRGAGLLPLLDAIGVRHSAGFALKLERRGRPGAVFSQTAGESLEHPGFVGDVAGRQAQGIADRLILSFDQVEISALGSVQMAALTELGRLGFRFAIERLTNLDMDFEALVAAGFAFVKLDAEVFADGLALGTAVVPAQELTTYFRERGLTLIVGRIGDEAMRARMVQYGVAFGQGDLFGAPRPVPMGSLDGSDGLAA